MSTQYKSSMDVPTEILAARLNELADVVAKKRDRIGAEFTMRIPAEVDRDADLVMSEAAVRLEALQAECEKLRKDAERYVPLNEAVQRAATELPEGWEIQLCVMRDSGWVDLIGPDGTEDFDTDNERLDYTVIDALEFAINAAMQEDNP